MEKVIIGKIGAPHGIFGAVRIIPMTDFLDRFAQLKNTLVFLKKDEREISVKVKDVRYVNQGQKIFMIFEGYDAPEKSRLLANQLLCVEKKDAVPLEEGEFYIFDLLGSEIFDADTNERIGTLKDIFSIGCHDVYVIQPQASAKEILLPAVHDFVKKILADEKKIFVKIPEEI